MAALASAREVAPPLSPEPRLFPEERWPRPSGVWLEASQLRRLPAVSGARPARPGVGDTGRGARAARGDLPVLVCDAGPAAPAVGSARLGEDRTPAGAGAGVELALAFGRPEAGSAGPVPRGGRGMSPPLSGACGASRALLPPGGDGRGPRKRPCAGAEPPGLPTPVPCARTPVRRPWRWRRRGCPCRGAGCRPSGLPAARLSVPEAGALVARRAGRWVGAPGAGTPAAGRRLPGVAHLDRSPWVTPSCVSGCRPSRWGTALGQGQGCPACTFQGPALCLAERPLCVDGVTGAGREADGHREFQLL